MTARGTHPGSAVAVVTDSTADLPAELVAKHAIAVVPLQVALGGRGTVTDSEAGAAVVAAALTAGETVRTSQPAPAAFEAVYRELARGGASAVVSVHLSGQLSGTVGAARLAAAAVPDLDVRVVDSGSVAMGLGFAAVAAAEAAASGTPADAVVDVAERTAQRAQVLIYVDTLEYLRRGGRIGAAAHLVGSALAMKPLLHVAGGQVAPLVTVRTKDKARRRLVDLAVQHAGDAPVDVAVEHLGTPDVAERLAGALRERLPQLRALHLGPIGAVVGAHVGPGALLVVVAPA